MERSSELGAPLSLPNDLNLIWVAGLHGKQAQEVFALDDVVKQFFFLEVDTLTLQGSRNGAGRFHYWSHLLFFVQGHAEEPGLNAIEGEDKDNVVKEGYLNFMGLTKKDLLLQVCC